MLTLQFDLSCCWTVLERKNVFGSSPGVGTEPFVGMNYMHGARIQGNGWFTAAVGRRLTTCNQRSQQWIEGFLLGRHS